MCACTARYVFHGAQVSSPVFADEDGADIIKGLFVSLRSSRAYAPARKACRAGGVGCVCVYVCALLCSCCVVVCAVAQLGLQGHMGTLLSSLPVSSPTPALAACQQTRSTPDLSPRSSAAGLTFICLCRATLAGRGKVPPGNGLQIKNDSR